MQIIKNSEDAKYKVLDWIVFGSIAAIFFLCPLFFTGMVNQGIGFEKSLLFYFFTLAGVVAWATKGITSGELKLKRTPLDIPILATLVIFTVTSVFSVSIRDSLIGFYGSPIKSMAAVVVFILFYYLVVNNLDFSKIKKLFWTLFISGSILLIFSVLQIFKIYLLPFLDITKNMGFNPLGSLTALTIYLVCILPIFLIAATQINAISPKLKNKSIARAARIIGSAMVILDLAVLFLLNGYTYWPVAVVTSVIVLMFMLAKIVDYKQLDLILPIGVFLVLMIFLVLGNFNLVKLDLPSEVSLSRGFSYNIAKNALKTDPLLGSGLGTYYYNFSKHKDSTFNYSPLWNVRFDSATGSLFEFLPTVGILGTLSFLILFLILLSMSFIALIRTKDKEIQPIQLALFSGLMAAILFAVMFPFNTSLILVVLIFVIFTAGVSVNIYPEKFSTLNLSFKSSPKYALALAAIFLTVTAGVAFLFTMGIKLYLADFYAMKFISSNDQVKKIEYLTKSIALAPFQDNYYLALANYYMGLANQEVAGGKDQNKIQSYLSNAVQLGKQGNDLNKKYVGNNEALGLIYENASFYTRGALEWAETYYNEVIALEPANPVPNFRLALINMAKANAEEDEKEKEFYINEAIKKYDEAISKKNDLAAAYYGKGIAYEQLNKNDDAIEQLKSAAMFSNNNIDYQFELARLYFNRGIVKPELYQSASKEIAEGGVKEGELGSQPDESLSVEPDGATGQTIKLNEDLALAENIMTIVLANNPNHANSLYSLSLLYQKTNQTQKARLMIAKLLEILPDEPTKELVKKQFPGLY
jgi:tetratricopeptide (TPR) repeat protein